MNIEKSIFRNLWTHYTSLVSSAKTIELALKKRGDLWVEDHVAFRTLPGKYTGSHVLQEMFEMIGYVRRDDYFFADKQLNAFWMEPRHVEEAKCEDVAPKIFISEIILDTFSQEFQNIISQHVAQVKTNPLTSMRELFISDKELFIEEFSNYLIKGPPWARPVFSDYETLRKKSEYAAWTLVFGSCVNHFTVSVQLMSTFAKLQNLNEFIAKELKIPLNESGGLIKGTAAVGLEQSSTLAAVIPIQFQDGIKKLPYAFIEFAFRHPVVDKKADGLWSSYYQGFVVGNADKIFESTNLR